MNNKESEITQLNVNIPHSIDHNDGIKKEIQTSFKMKSVSHNEDNIGASIAQVNSKFIEIAKNSEEKKGRNICSLDEKYAYYKGKKSKQLKTCSTPTATSLIKKKRMSPKSYQTFENNREGLSFIRKKPLS